MLRNLDGSAISEIALEREGEDGRSSRWFPSRPARVRIHQRLCTVISLALQQRDSLEIGRPPPYLIEARDEQRRKKPTASAALRLQEATACFLSDRHGQMRWNVETGPVPDSPPPGHDSRNGRSFRQQRSLVTGHPGPDEIFAEWLRGPGGEQTTGRRLDLSIERPFSRPSATE